MEKKSLVNTLKSTKKEVNVIAAPAKNEGATSRKSAKRSSAAKRATFKNFKVIS